MNINKLNSSLHMLNYFLIFLKMLKDLRELFLRQQI